MTTRTFPPQETAAAPLDVARRLWDRRLPRYPANVPRYRYLAITVLATVELYYQLYIQGAVATQIMADLHLSFTSFVFVSVVGNLVGAFASLFAGMADRWGRANLVVTGLLITALITGLALPNASSGTVYLVLFAVLSFVEGIVLVATPALIRDFSPQVGRGTAMGFWTLGPVLGSLVVTEVSSHTLSSHPDWRFQFYLCGVIGAIVWLVALFGLRELSPALRDQLMVSMRDRALIEARAAGIDPEQALKGHWRQMLRIDVIGSAFAISVYLLLYYVLVGFAVVYFATVYGYSPARANSLANWYWITNACTLVVVGVLSDRFRVRKPFMILGALINLVGTVLFALSATHHQDYYTLAVYFMLGSAGGGMAYVAWMASFTETVERHNPAATATGLAIWGWTLRLVVTGSLAILPLVVPATSTLVDHGARVQELATKYKEPLGVLQSLDPATAKALSANPGDVPALSKALGEVATQQGATPAQARAVSAAVVNRAPQLAAVKAVPPATLATLRTAPADPAAGATAVGAITEKLHVTQQQATALLQSLADPAVRSDLQLVDKFGTVLKSADTAVPKADLAYLEAHGAAVQKAAADNPHQWQTWWWVCVAGQILFLPFVFLMAGRWSPRRAREDERAHEEMVQRELAALADVRA
ncbi:MFS transporter [Streptomyces sp. NPDC047079]|uniref:MFS transporter n=1 Tax=Streptomyces sp. NPDC047079 TaxID=3154607 RepID=UPI0033DD1B62